MKFIVNGKQYQMDALPGEMLVDLLRERLELTGTKVGCNEAECGACTVLVEGEPVLSCCYPAARIDGKEVITIEGLATCIKRSGSEDLHPLQQAFIAYGVVQCGFCIPGLLMSAAALLISNPNPNQEQIKYALKNNLCRCASYPTILRAIQAAAEAMRNHQPVKAPVNVLENHRYPVNEHYLIGKYQIRPDAVGKVTGDARYTDDLQFDGLLHAAVKRAGVPHAFLRKLDISKARLLPGVVAILTAEDIPGEQNHGLITCDWPVMVGIDQRVRTVGDAVAIVAAEQREIALQAVDLIDVEYDLQPVVKDAVQALMEGVPQLHAGGNLLKHIKILKGDADKGFAQADVILEHTFHTKASDHLFMEPECSIARLSGDGRMEIYVGSQIPYADRNQVARVLGLPDERVRVIGQLVGGGFGGKEDIAGQIHAALLANTTQRPVKLLFDRRESLLVHPKRHATQIKVKIGAKADGRLTAIATKLIGDTGAYASLGEKVMTRATTHSSGPYEVAHSSADCYAVYTNNPPAGAFRGFGVPQSTFAIESMIDMLAEQLGMDAIELRRMNAFRVGSVTNTGQILTESVGLQECIDRVEQEMKRLGGEKPFVPHRKLGAEHLVQAWGFAAAYKNTGLGGGVADKASAEVELLVGGTLEVRTASAEVGQGLVTCLAMIVAEEFQIPADHVRVTLMDTDLTPDGGPTTASRQTFMTGNAARYAAKALRQAIAVTLAERYDLSPSAVRFGEGFAVLDGRFIPLADVGTIMHAKKRQPRALYEYCAPATVPLGQGGDMHFAYSFAAQAVEVEVNTLTGVVRVLRVIAANDVGKAINPLGLRAQVEGGVMMGIGNALMEDFIVENGEIITDRMATYRIPSIMESPEIISLVVEHPTAEGPYGAKGLGEIVSIPTSPAVTNAIYNAVGVRIDRLPVDQEYLLKCLQS